MPCRKRVKQLRVNLTEKFCLNYCLSFQQKNFVMVIQQEIKQIYGDLTGFFQFDRKF